MDLPPFPKTVREKLHSLASALEKNFNGDCLLYMGEIHPNFANFFAQAVHELKNSSKRDLLVIVLQTLGGSAEVTEKMVDIVRYHYKEVYFVVPHYAMSAGTIFCMSGDKIYMDFQSSLGPIDPQVFNGKGFVPAQGYLDQFQALIKKSAEATISPGELQMLLSFDLADLSRYEQAKNLTVTLLTKWLVEYKFKNWDTHKSNPDLLGKTVSLKEKEKRAKDIAKQLGDNSIWHSHSRYINLIQLRKTLKLEIDDYSQESYRGTILEYNDLAEAFMHTQGFQTFIHTRLCF